jgi:spermidine/putrescine-binding protein
MAGNARTFSNSSSQLLDDVSNGEAVMAPAIDFYATTRIARAGADKLGYVEPRGQRVVTADPIGILRGAAHREMARDFVALVMSPEGQKLWMHKKGSPGGPQGNELYRLAANPAMFKPLAAESLIRTNPYEGRNEFRFNPQKSSTRRRALDDLLGAVLIDNHDPLKARWEKTPDPSKIAFVPVSEAELTKLAAKWDDATFRNAKISEWSQAARKHFSS